MKVKIGTILEAELVKKLKLEAAETNLKLNELVERALWQYFSISPSERKENTAQRTKGMIPIGKKALRTLLKKEPSLHET